MSCVQKQALLFPLNCSLIQFQAALKEALVSFILHLLKLVVMCVY